MDTCHIHHQKNLDTRTIIFNMLPPHPIWNPTPDNIFFPLDVTMVPSIFKKNSASHERASRLPYFLVVFVHDQFTSDNFKKQNNKDINIL